MMKFFFLFCYGTFLVLSSRPITTWAMIVSSSPSPSERSSSSSSKNHNQLLQKSNKNQIYKDASLLILPQTDRDRHIESWFCQHKILVGHERKVQISTTTRSVGGRGVFWTPQPSSSSLIDNTQYAGVANQGDILAHIPGNLVLLPSNLQGSYPCLFHNNNCDDVNDKLTWQSILTTYAWKALNDRRTTNNSMNNFWHEWIKTWTTTGGDGNDNDNIPTPKSYEDYTSDELHELARLAHATPNEVRECITSKHQTFEKDWDAVRSLIVDDNDKDNNMSMKQQQELKKEFAKLYSLVLSRTTNLGPEWGDQLGVIPLHDMINHPPYGTEPNVELFCLGDIRATIGNDNLKLLLRPLLTEKQLRGEEEPPVFMDHDFVIAARKRIDPYEELFLSYKNGIDDMDGKQQLWLLLQYGFPFCPS